MLFQVQNWVLPTLSLKVELTSAFERDKARHG
ncbi:MAG: hypothetical protein PWQ96_1627, partial [Clostridia bacterium]|nr:hypothetical protein [Clostridia bacterium]